MTARRAILVAAMLVGCQLVVPSDELQCKTDGDCDARGGDFAKTSCVDALCVPHGDRCVGHVAPVVEDRTKPLHARLRFTDVGGNPLKNVEVLVCANLDESCESPIGAAALTDSSGYVYLTIWKNFLGTFQVKHPPTTSDFFKLKIHSLGGFTTDDSPTREIPLTSSVRLLTHTLFSLQLGSFGTLDPKAGHIIGLAADCDQAPRAGVHIAFATNNTGKPLPFYFSDLGLVAADTSETSTGGLFGIVNAPAGPVQITSTIASSGKLLGQVQVFVNADTISNLQVGPTPVP